MINLENYEQYALDYIDGTLNKQVEQEFESFLNLHPQIHLEIKEVASLSYPYENIRTTLDSKVKESLYKKSRNKLNFSLVLIVGLLFLISTLVAIYYLNQDITIPNEKDAENKPMAHINTDLSADHQHDLPVHTTISNAEIKSNISSERPQSSTALKDESRVNKKTTDSTPSKKKQQSHALAESSLPPLDHSGSLNQLPNPSTLSAETDRSSTTINIDQIDSQKPKYDSLVVATDERAIQPIPTRPLDRQTFTTDMPTISSLPNVIEATYEPNHKRKWWLQILPTVYANQTEEDIADNSILPSIFTLNN